MTDERTTDERATGEPVTDERATGGAPPPARSSARAKAAAVLAAVFLLGAFAGGAAGRLSALREMRHMTEGPPREARARFRLETMRRHLGLRDDQAARLEAILTEADAERDRLVAACGPGLDDLRRRTDARVRELLDDDQRRRFDDMNARRGRPPGPWPPPPPPR